MEDKFTIICVEDYETGFHRMDENISIKKGDKFLVRFEYMYEDEEDPSQNVISTDYFFSDEVGYLPNKEKWFLTLEDFREEIINQII